MNETKTAILTCLSGGGWRTSPQVAQACGLKLTNASELLRRYRGQGLVIRLRNPGVPRGYLYRITTAGLGRLQYLTPPVIEPYPDEIQPYVAPVQPYSAVSDQIGLSGKKKQVFDQWFESQMKGG